MKHLLIIFFVLITLITQAQTLLSIDDAVKIALEKNYDISIARNEALILKTNNTLGSAGMLPNISVSGSGNYAKKNNTQGQQDSDLITTNNGITTINAAAELSWTIFDGGKMFVTKAKLAEIEAEGEIQFKQKVLETLSKVIAAYYSIVKQKQQLVSIEQLINYNKERVKIAEAGFSSGAKKKSDLLQAKIDLNVNKQSAINQETLILSAKRELARLLVSDNDIDFDVSTDFLSDYNPTKEDLLQQLYVKNKSVLVFEKQLDIQELVLKESYRSLLPKINFNTGYYFQNINNQYNGSRNQTVSRTLWPQVGGSITIPIFQGGYLNRQVTLSRINRDLARYDLENLKLLVNTELQIALATFENQKKLLEIERENFQLAKENLEISLHRMRLGEATSLEVRMAQSDFEDSSTRLVNIQYNLKLTETKLKQLMGEL